MHTVVNVAAWVVWIADSKPRFHGFGDIERAVSTKREIVEILAKTRESSDIGDRVKTVRNLRLASK